jgi:hypothetical protein
MKTLIRRLVLVFITMPMSILFMGLTWMVIKFFSNTSNTGRPALEVVKEHFVFNWKQAAIDKSEGTKNA